MLSVALFLLASFPPDPAYPSTVPPPPQGYVVNDSEDMPPCVNGAADCNPWERDWKGNPFNRFDKSEKLGPGPHALVVADGQAITQMDYKTGPSCQKARDAIRRQLTPKPQPGVIYGPPRTNTFCVPR